MLAFLIAVAVGFMSGLLAQALMIVAGHRSRRDARQLEPLDGSVPEGPFDRFPPSRPYPVPPAAVASREGDN